MDKTIGKALLETAKGLVVTLGKFMFSSNKYAHLPNHEIVKIINAMNTLDNQLGAAMGEWTPEKEKL